MNRGQADMNWLLPADEIADVCADFIQDTVDEAGAAGVVIGLSGGIDSAVSAALAVRGLGADAVHGVFLPYLSSNPASLRDGQAVAESLGIESRIFEITGMVDPWLVDIPVEARVRRGNVMARCRMIALYDISARMNRLVLGTGNRTETLLGYSTLHGDAACGLNPLAYLYKAEVRELARYLELPAAVIEKAPSADLWEGQSDEEELGFTYAEADRLLHHLVDEGLERGQLRTLGFSDDLIDRITAIIFSQAFKWLPVPAPEFPNRPLPAVVEQDGADG